MNSTIETPAAPDPVASTMPDMPGPTKEHAWLERFAGDWTSEAEIVFQPGQPPTLCPGSEAARMLGGFWLVARGRGESTEMPFESVLTLGYDPKRGKYIGSWIDTMTSHLWHYEGTVNAAGTILSLDTEGECPMSPGVSKFREVTEFKSDDHRVFTSSIQGADGTWSTMVTVNYRRKK